MKPTTFAPARGTAWTRSFTPHPDQEPGLDLLERLAYALQTEGILYCQWKGHWSGHRWATGEGDIDLLVDRKALPRFRTLVQELGFKSALPSGARQIPGVESYFGHDPALARLLHLHVHYQLAVGDYWRTVYRLPIERPMLEAAEEGSLFRVPSPPYQLIVFVLRLLLRQRDWPFPARHPRWVNGIQGQLEYLEGRCEREALAAILAQHLPSIDLPLFDRCVGSLRLESEPGERARTRREIHRRLRAHTRRPSFAALVVAAVEKALPRPMARAFSDNRMALVGGGSVLALIGGDGAGKSTCGRELGRWLGEDFPTLCAHLGRPPRSLTTLVIGGALKLERRLYQLGRRPVPVGSQIELLRHICTARDRYRLYEKVRRFAAAGGLAVCERYPVPQNRFLVGPCIPSLIGPAPSRRALLLRDIELSYYKRILPPDALFVLRLDPELAVIRKPDEPADYVRTRGRVIWETDWSTTGAHVVDASRPLSQVLQDLKTRVWSVL